MTTLGSHSLTHCRSTTSARHLALSLPLVMMIGACVAGDDGAEASGTLALDSACGNGVFDPGEQCDDGNNADHDGCSATCTVELVARFSFTGAAGNEATFAADVADPGLTAVPVMSRGPGVTPSIAAGAFSASAWTTGQDIDPNDYFSFTVAPAPGHAMNLIAFQLDERRSATGIGQWSVRSSLDGFATNLAGIIVPDDTGTRTSVAALPERYRGLTTPVEFRIFGFQAEAAGGTWRIDNVTLIGGVASNCGNGVFDPGEQCDDGNNADHDGCSAMCTAEFVAQFSFTGAAGNEATFAADVADPALAAIPVMSRGLGVTPSLAAGAFSASGWTTGQDIDPNDYFSFTVAPTPGHVMNLQAFMLDERRSATGIGQWSVRSSLDDFATNLAGIIVPDDTGTRLSVAALPERYRGLTAPVEFRIFGFQAEAAGGTWRIDNVKLFGGVDVAR